MNDNADKKKADISALEKSIQERIKKLESDANSANTKEGLTKSGTIDNLHSKSEWWSVADAMTISSAVLIFGSIIMLLATYLLHKGKNADEVLKLFGTIIIIISAVFLVVAGYTDTQIAPVIGLLGTIAGYLLGRRSNETPPPDTKPVEIKAAEIKSSNENPTTQA
jgi:VIT1/CCC1 family predicted Fe2+/Mn2+ transporter